MATLMRRTVYKNGGASYSRAGVKASVYCGPKMFKGPAPESIEFGADNLAEPVEVVDKKAEREAKAAEKKAAREAKAAEKKAAREAAKAAKQAEKDAKRNAGAPQPPTPEVKTETADQVQL